MESPGQRRTPQINGKSRKFAILASFVILVGKLSSYAILSSRRLLSFDLDLFLNIQGTICYWLLPFLVVYLLEKRQVETLGLKTGRFKISFYVVLIVISVILPVLYLGLSREIILQVLEQILFIAFAEEFLWRGYFQKRLSDWVGSVKGIVIASALFGIGHIVSIHAIEGYLDPLSTLSIFAQTTAGGLIFGYLFYWSRSIWPGAFLHLFGNVFLFRII